MKNTSILAHVPTPKGVASDPFTGSGAYVSGSGGVEASRFTGKLLKDPSYYIFYLK